MSVPNDLQSALDEVDEQNDDLDEPVVEPETDETNRLVEWARRTPDGTHTDWDPRDVWDPDGGGRARLAFHLSDLAGSDGQGLPNAAGVVLSLIEIYVTLTQQSGDERDRGDDGTDETEQPTTVARDTARQYV